MKVKYDNSVYGQLLRVLNRATTADVEYVLLTTLERKELEQSYGIEFVHGENSGLFIDTESITDVPGHMRVIIQDNDPYSKSRRRVKGDGRVLQITG